MDEKLGRDTRRLALATGVVAVGSAASLATYFAVQGPFGTINDIGNAAIGILSGCLAWRLRREGSGPSDPFVGAAVAGAALTVAGSALVVSGTTGFFLAGLVSSVGYAGIGAWLVAVSRGSLADTWSPWLRRLGLVAGVLMAFGIVMIPGILQRLDDMATAPAWVWIGFVGWLGTFVAYPAWAIWLGLARTHPAGTAVSASGGVRA